MKLWLFSLYKAVNLFSGILNFGAFPPYMESLIYSVVLDKNQREDIWVKLPFLFWVAGTIFYSHLQRHPKVSPVRKGVTKYHHKRWLYVYVISQVSVVYLLIYIIYTNTQFRLTITIQNPYPNTERFSSQDWTCTFNSSALRTWHNFFYLTYFHNVSRSWAALWAWCSACIQKVASSMPAHYSLLLR